MGAIHKLPQEAPSGGLKATSTQLQLPAYAETTSATSPARIYL